MYPLPAASAHGRPSGPNWGKKMLRKRKTSARRERGSGLGGGRWGRAGAVGPPSAGRGGAGLGAPLQREGSGGSGTRTVPGLRGQRGAVGRRGLATASQPGSRVKVLGGRSSSFGSWPRVGKVSVSVRCQQGGEVGDRLGCPVPQRRLWIL